MKIEESIKIINMLTSRINIKNDFTKKECEDIHKYIYTAMNNF